MMSPKIFIVSTETFCPLSGYQRHIESQTFFRNKEKAFDYFKNLIEHKCSELNYKYVYSSPIAFRDLKQRFLMMESMMEIQLRNKHNGILFMVIRSEYIKTDTEV